MADNDEVEARGRAWIEQACKAVGVDPDLVDVGAVLDLTRQVAHNKSRPLAPVGSYILGVAVGAADDASPERRAQLLEALVSTLPPDGDG